MTTVRGHGLIACMSAMFEFSGGALSVTPSSSDTQVSFEIFNVGTDSGTAEVGCEVDGNYVNTWTGTLSPNVGDRPTVSLGAVSEGNHTALVYVNPGSGNNDHLQQDFTV
jgi:hypothetical protein